MSDRTPKLLLADLLILLSATALYLIPPLLGYSWNALGAGYNSLNPVEGYHGRLNDQWFSVDSWGTSVVCVPLRSKIRDYFNDGDWPLWNPYQGLGQPFAAQGEGCPYFPLAIARSLLPYSCDNIISGAHIFLAGSAMLLFLLEIGLSRETARFGAVAFMMSGAVSLHIARYNILDQNCMIPILFLSLCYAARRPSMVSMLLFATVSFFHAIAGFIQIAFITAIVAGAVAPVLAYRFHDDPRQFRTVTIDLLIAFAVGNALSAFYFLPFAEAAGNSFNKNASYGGFNPVSSMNAVAFFFPTLASGVPHGRGWMPPSHPAIPHLNWNVFWDNLYGFSSVGVFLSMMIGFAIPKCKAFTLKHVYWCFVVIGLLLITRYISVCPGFALNTIPIIGRQTPKHSNGLMVFVFIVAAAVSLDSISSANRRTTFWIIAAALSLIVLEIVGRVGQGVYLTSGLGIAEISRTNDLFRERFPVHFCITLFVTAAYILMFRISLYARDGGSRLTSRAMTLLALGEGILTIPLGNGAVSFLWLRLGICVVLTIGAFCLRLRWIRSECYAIGASLVCYAMLVALPAVGLPERFDIDSPPAYMDWLRGKAQTDYRSFGIPPDHSCLAGVRDISCVGPMAPRSYFRFIDIITDKSGRQSYELSTHFMLSGPWMYDLSLYRKYKAIFDWMGVKYLVLDRSSFNHDRRQDHLPLELSGVLSRCYEDDRVRILSSEKAAPRAEFWTGVTVVKDKEVIVSRLKEDPESIFGQPTVAGPPDLFSAIERPGSRSLVFNSTNGTFGRNTTRISFVADSSGLLVLKDASFCGWRARVDGRECEVVEVNAMTNGVVIQGPGRHLVEVTYCPKSVRMGLGVSIASLALLLTIPFLCLFRFAFGAIISFKVL